MKPIKKFLIDKQIRFGYGAALFLLLISYLLTLYTNRQLLNQSRLVDHTNKVILSLETLLSSVKDAETGCRGYIITKDENFLEHYKKSQQTADSLLRLLQIEASGNSYKDSRITALKDITHKEFDLLALSVNYYSKNHFVITDTLQAKAYFGEEVMDRIRNMVSQMQAEEHTLLAHRSDQLSARYNSLNLIVIISLLLAFCLAIYGLFTYARENRARRMADEQVFGYQEQLKQQIEELNRANKELVQMRSIEKLAATGRIARTIAHEVRNPLTNINLSVDQIKIGMDNHNESTQELLDMILRNSNRINQLITDLLNSTKSTELNFQRMSIHRILDETLLLAMDRIQLNHINVIKAYSEEIGEVSVDVEKIKIAFLNIIVNAIEAMEPGKGILHLETEGKNGKCTVIIKDNGTGIDKESLSKLFEPYFSNKTSGTGLGLTNTHNIIIRHKGHIHVESEIEKGTTFIIALEFA